MAGGWGEPKKTIKRNVMNLDFSRYTVGRLNIKKKGEAVHYYQHFVCIARKKKNTWFKQRDYVNKKKIAIKPEHGKNGYIPEGKRSGYFVA